MDQDFTKEDVIAACLITTQKDQSEEHFKRAERYLIAFQKAPEAWALSSEILNTEDLQLAVYAQVAIFLKQKLQYDFAQLPQSEYLNITQVILKFLMKHYHTAIVSQLSLSLVLLYMHAFETLGDLIDILGQTLFTVDKKDVIALDIIKLLAEVVEDKRIIISKKQKDRYTTYLEEFMKPKVFALLDKIARAENIDKGVKFKILDAFQEWFYFARKDESIIKDIASHSCFLLSLTSMNDDSLAEHARECLNFIIKAVKNPEQHPVIFEAIFKHILEYMNECNVALQKDIDHVLEYTKVFRAFGMKFSKIMIANPNEGLIKFLEYLVQLTANQKIIIDILVELEDFWKGFAEEFTSLLKKKQYAHKVEEFQKLIKTLILISLHRIKMTGSQLEFIESRNRRPVNPEDEEEDKIGAVDPDLRDLEEKQNERRLSKNILLHMQDILGFQATFTIISEALSELLIKLQESNINWADPGFDVISNFECIFYGAKSSILAHPLDYRPDLTEFFKVVMPIKFENVKFNRTKIELIDYTSGKAIVGDEIMPLMFNYLAENLLNPRLIQENGEALITLCQNWSSFVIRNFDSFLELRSKFEDNDELVIALAVAIAYDKQAALRERYLAQLCAPFAERIVKNADLPDTETDEKILEEIRDNLRKLAMIFGNMPKSEDETGTHPLEPVFQELWPIFKALFKKYQDKPKVIMKLCNVMKKCMRALSLKFKPYLLEYFDVICEIFVINPLPDLLYSIETSASVFGKVADLIQPLTKVFEFISSATLNYVSDKNIKEHNQLIEDFFGLLFRYTKYIPSVILSSKTLEANLFLADLIIGIDQPNVEKTLYLFLEYLFKLCSYNPQNEVEKAVTEIMINKYGAIYMKKLLIELTKYPGEQLRSYLLDVIFGSILKLKRHTVEWIEAGLQEIPEAILSQSERQDMVRHLNDIDTSTLKLKNKDEEESEKLIKISQKFTDVFDFFEERCKLYVMRDYRFERANQFSS